VKLDVKPLWTPWRMPYILAIKSHDGCVFCDEVLAEGRDPDLVIHRGRAAFVVLNLYPYTTGHLMVVPYRHLPSMVDLSAEELAESTSLLQTAESVLEEEYGMRAHHVGVNIGHCAGAGVEGHLHIHIVPRGRDDALLPPDGTHDGPAEPLAVTKDRLALAWHRSTRYVLDHSSET
jgi:ATP adenylyltransferase